MTDERKIYEQKLDAELAGWNKQLAELKTRAERAEVGARGEYHKTIDALQRRRAEATSRLGKLKAANDEAWSVMKTGAEKAWGEIGAAFQSAASRVH